MNKDFAKKIEEVLNKDSRYRADAYEFTLQALMFTQKKIKRNDHVSGKELLEGIREFGLEQYGPMTRAVFEHWGVKATEDFGEIVFNMVEHGLLRKTEEDSRRDFKNVYDFSQAFDTRELFKLDK